MEKRKGKTVMESSPRENVTIVEIMATEIQTVGETEIKMTTETTTRWQ